MPSYDWSCHLCNSANTANSDRCKACDFPAVASGADIAKARKRLAANHGKEPAPELQHDLLEGLQNKATSAREPEAKQSHETLALWGLLLGIVCLAGGYQSLTSGHWPIYMPPQLDFFALPLTWLSEEAGAIVGGILACLVGVLCLIGGAIALASPPQTQQQDNGR